jgi:hypothetical protein
MFRPSKSPFSSSIHSRFNTICYRVLNQTNRHKNNLENKDKIPVHHEWQDRTWQE